MSASKRELRHQGRMRRSLLSVAERGEKSRMIHRHLRELIDGKEPVMIYVSKPPEVETHALIQEFIASGKRVIVPIIERETQTLRLSFLSSMKTLTPSTFNVPEPIGNEMPASPVDIVVAVIPLLAFDRYGNRIGYGAGYYDRFLCRCPNVRRIGIAFSCQEVPRIPVEAEDVRMEWIVTEQGICDCTGSRDA